MDLKCTLISSFDMAVEDVERRDSALGTLELPAILGTGFPDWHQ